MAEQPRYLKGVTSEEKMHDFLKTHYFQWWGDPMQATTYSTLKTDVHTRLVELIDLAVAEAIEKAQGAEQPDAYGYRRIAHQHEFMWSEPSRPADKTWPGEQCTTPGHENTNGHKS